MTEQRNVKNIVLNLWQDNYSKFKCSDEFKNTIIQLIKVMSKEGIIDKIAGFTISGQLYKCINEFDVNINFIELKEI